MKFTEEKKIREKNREREEEKNKMKETIGVTLLKIMFRDKSLTSLIFYLKINQNKIKIRLGPLEITLSDIGAIEEMASFSDMVAG